eukprot:TRINITY_DN895_c0_g1_i1.p1 TRINITY_DN895_c0_g1~~TRINITY_DN895_c0_g1_i1.p1  ORF type:complete len:261 (-),score=84.69 TRINITY_DN895_c0_g1_i1:29-811(-)
MEKSRKIVGVVVSNLDNVTTRDKLYRTIQYFLRFFNYFLLKKKQFKSFSARLSSLEKGISDTRRLMRFGKFMLAIKDIINLDPNASPIIQLFTVLRAICNSIYFPLDHIVWLAKTKVLHVDAAYFQLNASRGWFLAVIFSFLIDTITYFNIKYQLSQLYQKKQQLLIQNQSNNDSNNDSNNNNNENFEIQQQYNLNQQEIKKLNNRINAIIRRIILDFADMPVSANGAFKNLDLNTGFVGFCGSLSSLLALYELWFAKRD